MFVTLSNGFCAGLVMCLVGDCSYKSEDKYIVSQLPEPMYHEVSVLPCLLCGTFKKRLLEVNLWVSSGGSRSLLHRDADNAINCLLHGRLDQGHS